MIHFLDAILGGVFIAAFACFSCHSFCLLDVLMAALIYRFWSYKMDTINTHFVTNWDESNGCRDDDDCYNEGSREALLTEVNECSKLMIPNV
jgi:hypothetical protein